MKSLQPEAEKPQNFENLYYQKHQKNQYYLKYTTCDVPKDVTNGIGCVCGKITIGRILKLKIYYGENQETNDIHHNNQIYMI